VEKEMMPGVREKSRYGIGPVRSSTQRRVGALYFFVQRPVPV